MDEKLKFVRGYKKSDVYENNKYKITVSFEPNHFKEKDARYFSDNDNEDDFTEVAFVQIQNKENKKLSSKLLFRQSNIIDIIQDYLDGKSLGSEETEERISSMFKQVD